MIIIVMKLATGMESIANFVTMGVLITGLEMINVIEIVMWKTVIETMQIVLIIVHQDVLYKI